MSRDIIHTDHAPAAVGTYSQAVKVDKTVYISGQIGLDPNTMTLADGFVNQANQVMSNIDAICQAAGGSLANVVKFNVSPANSLVATDPVRSCPSRNSPIRCALMSKPMTGYPAAAKATATGRPT